MGSRFAIFVFTLSSLLAIAIFLPLDKQSTSENLEETTTKIESQDARAESELLINEFLEEIELTEYDKERLYAKWVLSVSPIFIPMMIIILRWVATSFFLAKFEETQEYYYIAILLSAFYVFSYSFVLKAIYYAVP